MVQSQCLLFPFLCAEASLRRVQPPHGGQVENAFIPRPALWKEAGCSRTILPAFIQSSKAVFHNNH